MRSPRVIARAATCLSAARSPPPVRHFVNLSNGAEALPLLAAAGLPAEQVQFCRIQSSHCEAQDFYGVLSNLDHNLLMHLALGFECRVYDFGSRGNFWQTADRTGTEQLWVPRALWWGCEWSRYALETLWHLESATTEGGGGADGDEAPPHPGVGMLRNNRVRDPLLRGYNVRKLFDDKLRVIPKPLWKKLKYYRAHLAPGLSEVRLRGYYAGTELDGKKDAYRGFLHGHAAESAARAQESPDPASFDTPLRWYDAQTMLRVGEVKGD